MANLIFSFHAVSPTYCVKQFEQVIKYIGLNELQVTLDFSYFVQEKVLCVTELIVLSVGLKKEFASMHLDEIHL